MSMDDNIDLDDLSRRIAEDDGQVPDQEATKPASDPAPLDDAFAGIREKLQADTDTALAAPDEDAVADESLDVAPPMLTEDTEPMVEALESDGADTGGFGTDTIWNGTNAAAELEARDFETDMPDLAANAESSVAALFASGAVAADTSDDAPAEVVADGVTVADEEEFVAASDAGDDTSVETADETIDAVADQATSETEEDTVALTEEAGSLSLEEDPADGEEVAASAAVVDTSLAVVDTSLADVDAPEGDQASDAADDAASPKVDDHGEPADAPLVLSASMSAVAVSDDDDLPSIAMNTPEAFPDGMDFDPDQRRPRICLMGEFSAGKSTLSNLLLGARSLPVNVTATQLPPVWISYGDRSPFRVDLDGVESPVDLNKIEDIPVEETSHIRIFRKADILEICDLIDMPGISDPNMSAEVWQRMLPRADAVIWCTHATQAWRQSEAAVWSMMDADLQKKSLLLLTRMDKILTDRDRMRVMRRVGKETAGLFRAQFGVSLLKALEAGDDEAIWKDSGADDFVVELVGLIREIARDLEDPSVLAREEAMAVSTSLTQRPTRVANVSDAGLVAAPAQPDELSGPRVSPQRVRPKAASIDPARRSSRPSPRNDLGL